MAQFDFETSSAPKRDRNFDLLPAGSYKAQVVDSEILPIAEGRGQALKLTFDVLEDGYRNRRLWARLNIRHSDSPTSERIANEQLRELCESIGVVRMSDTTELHNKPVTIRVKIREDKTGKYEPQNDVVGYKPIDGLPTHGQQIGGTIGGAISQRPAAPAANSSAPQSSSPPWAKKAA